LAAFTEDKQENGSPRASSRDSMLSGAVCPPRQQWPAEEISAFGLATLAIHKGASIGFRAIGEREACRALEARQAGACIAEMISLSRGRKKPE